MGLQYRIVYKKGQKTGLLMLYQDDLILNWKLMLFLVANQLGSWLSWMLISRMYKLKNFWNAWLYLKNLMSNIPYMVGL